MARTSAAGPALFKEMTIAQWVNVFNKENITVAKVDEDKKQLNIHCVHPGHSDSDASARLDLEYGNYHCWACNADRIYDPLQLLEIITNTPAPTLVSYVKENFGLQVSYKNTANYNTEYEEDTQKLNWLVEFGRWSLARVYEEYENTATGAPASWAAPPIDQANYFKAIAWLKKKSIEENDLPNFNIGILVGNGDIQSWVDAWDASAQRLNTIVAKQEFVDNLYCKYYENVLTHAAGALLFPHYISPNRVGRVQSRVDFLSAKTFGKKPLKFFYAGPIAEEKKIAGVTLSTIGRLVDSQAGFYGLDMVRNWPAAAVKDGLFLCEGATDTIAANLAQYRKHGVVVRPAIGIAGTGQKDLNCLSSLGVDKLWMLQDAPGAQGDEVAKTYLQKATKVDISLFTWPAAVSTYKDMHQIYQDAGPDVLFDTIINEQNYVSSVDFILSLLVKAAKGKGPEAIKALVESHTKWLGGRATQLAFVQAASDTFPFISVDEFENNILGIDDDTLDGCKRRIRRDLDDKFTFLFREKDVSVSDKPLLKLTFRDNVSGVITEMPYNKAGIKDAIAMEFDGYDAWAARAPLPSRILYRKSKAGVREDCLTSIVVSEMAAIVSSVMDRIVAGLPKPAHDTYTNLGNGVHSITDPKDKKNKKILLINGPYQFIGEFEIQPDGTYTIKWEDYKVFLREMPVLPKTVDNLWSSDILDIADLMEGQTIDPETIWDELYQVYNVGWDFIDQEADVIWLTALAIYAAVYDFTDRTLMTRVVGDCGSGKSKLIKDVFAGQCNAADGLPSLPFFYYTDFPSSTKAGIEQYYSGAQGKVRRGLVLDEFENDSFDSQRKIQQFEGQVRGMFDGEATSRKGTKTGQGREIKLRYPVLLAGILEYNDGTGAISSRFNRIEMRPHIPTPSTPVRPSPSSMVSQKTNIDVVALSRKVAIGLFHHALSIVEYTAHYANAMATAAFGMGELSHEQLPEERSQKSVAIVAAIMHVCGKSQTEISHACNVLFSKLTATKSNSSDGHVAKPGELAWDTIISYNQPIPDDKTPGLMATTTSRLSKISLLDAMLDPVLRTALGDADFFPAFYVVENQYLVIDHHYIKPLIKESFLQDWSVVVSQLRRTMVVLTKKDAKAIAVKAHRKFYAKEKKYLVIELPAELREDLINSVHTNDIPSPQGAKTGPTIAIPLPVDSSIT